MEKKDDIDLEVINDMEDDSGFLTERYFMMKSKSCSFDLEEKEITIKKVMGYYTMEDRAMWTKNFSSKSKPISEDKGSCNLENISNDLDKSPSESTEPINSNKSLDSSTNSKESNNSKTMTVVADINILTGHDNTDAFENVEESRNYKVQRIVRSNRKLVRQDNFMEQDADIIENIDMDIHINLKQFNNHTVQEDVEECKVLHEDTFPEIEMSKNAFHTKEISTEHDERSLSPVSLIFYRGLNTSSNPK